MKIEMQDLEPCVKKISVEVPVERVDEEKSLLYRELAKTASVPGFRKGHVPQSVLKRMYSKSVLGDVARKLIEIAYREAVEKNDLKPAGEPMVDDVKIEESEPLSFTATIEIFPNVELKDFSGLTLKRKITKVTDKEIDQILEQYQNRQAIFEPVEGRNVEEGDYPLIDYSATKEDGSPTEHFQGKNKQIQVVRMDMLGDFHANVIGMAKGEEKEFDGKLPKEYPDPELADTTVHFKVKINEIKKKVLPEINDQLAKEVSDFDSLDDLRADLRSNLEERNRQLAQNELHKSLMTKLIEENPFDLPSRTLEKQALALAEKAEQNLNMHGIKLDSAGINPEAMKKKSLDDAVRLLKVEVIMAAFAKAENLEVTDQDIEKEIEKMAAALNQAVDMTKRQIAESSQGVNAITHQAFTDKVYNAMLKKLTINDEIAEEINEK